MRDPDRGDVDLVLRLYDLRREAEMRAARTFIMKFDPRTLDDVKAVVSFVHPENAHFRQVMSYWGMVADFTSRGLLHPEMFAAHCGEALFIYAKFEALLPQIRAEINPMFLTAIENVVKAHPPVAQRLEQVRQMRAKMAALAPKPAPAAPAAPAKPPKKASKKGR
jgi:hypothetical protein